jgi:hypothetical protein
MRALLLVLLISVGLAACDTMQPGYNNPAPTRPSDIPSGQSHTNCPSGNPIC